MTTHARRLIVPAAIMPLFGLALAGCTNTVDSKSAENVIKSQLPKLGPVQATSVSCPSGIKKKQGVSFNCKVTLRNTSNNATAKGSITLHIVNNGSRAEFSQSDIHVGQ